ncbi:hypothetical protein ACGFZS_46975 [Streptomyces sp. NPDC048288]|uniref:hypothetical protein n=1 Tax=Streptomyces sp. NPDC048288 TaxID=3365529 RepID=UPI00370FCD8E
MTDPGVYARLDGLQAALSRPTPAPLDGQEAIDLDDAEADPAGDRDATQEVLW